MVGAADAHGGTGRTNPRGAGSPQGDRKKVPGTFLPGDGACASRGGPTRAAMCGGGTHHVSSLAFVGFGYRYPLPILP